MMVATAIAIADFVVVPLQGSTMDAKGAIKTVKLIRSQSRVARRDIPHSVVFTRTGAVIKTRSLKSIKAQLTDAGIDTFNTELVERAAYRELMEFGGDLHHLDPKQVSNLDKAIVNSKAFAGELVSKLSKRSSDESQSNPINNTTVEEVVA